MAYIGNKTDTAFTSLLKQDLTGASGTSLTLSHAVANANDIALYINNVRQEPTEAYSVNGTIVTLTGTVAGTDDIYVIYLARAVQTTVPPDGSVSSAKIANSAVTDAKVSAVSASKLSGSVLVANGGTGMTSQLVSSWCLNPNLSGSSNTIMTWTKDTGTAIGELIGTDVTHNNGAFSFPSTGIYKMTMDMQGRHPSSGQNYVGFTFESSSDSGSNYSVIWRRLTNNPSGAYFTCYSHMLYEVTNISTQRFLARTYINISGSVFDGSVGYTSCRLYIEKMS